MPVAELVLGWTELEAALPGYEEAELYADGEIDEVFADSDIKDALLKTGEAYRFALIRTPISVRADRCEIAALKVPGDEAATGEIERIWKANQMAIHYPIMTFKTLEYGDYYVMIWEVEDDPLETADNELISTHIEITTHSPKNCRVIYDPENQRRKWFAINRFQIRDEADRMVWRADLYFVDRVERWVMPEPDSRGDRRESWVPYSDEQGDFELPHDMGEIPFFHHRTGIPYGTPVHKLGYGAQNALTKMLVTQITTTDSHGFPQRFGLLDKDAVLDSNNDSPDWTDDTLATTASIAGVERAGGQIGNQRTGPGTMQTFEGMTEVGQFAAADPKVFLDPAELYIRLMAQLTTTPLHYFDPQGDAPSGESLKVADAPLVKSIEFLQLLLGATIEEEWRFALALAGYTVTDIDVRWAPVESATGLDDWQVVAAKIENGVPQDQALVEAGYDPDQVAGWLDSSAEAASLAARVNLLVQLGTAMQAIGASLALGVAEESAAQAAVGAILGEIIAAGATSGETA